ncbi:ferritin-like fold-containing protein [Luethyella okanaganae]|uniref:Ferritin-like fold-containing protein n=1 Tax=Luethyella okanaganae TaxID=69372 RepID=A0ABW1VDP3_9MICO
MEIPRLKPRGETASSARVDFSEMTPELLPFLGQAAYIQLEVFENLSRAVSTAPTLTAKEGLSAAAGIALAKHHVLIAEIRRRDAKPDEVMAPFRSAIDRYRAATTGSDWYELLLSSYLTAGMLDDFFIRLADGLPGDSGPWVAELLGRDAGTDVLVSELQAGIAADSRLGSRLAMWGRRLVGDTLLIARSALHGTGPETPVESRIEPVFTELVAAHTRRMDLLGLTA